MGAAYRQTSFWRDSETLWNHALQCTSRNGVAHTNVGVMLVDEGRFDEATAHFQQAIEILPNDALPYYNMGKVAMLCGNSDKAEDYLSKALKIDPRYAPTYNRLGSYSSTAASSTRRFHCSRSRWRSIAMTRKSGMTLVDP